MNIQEFLNYKHPATKKDGLKPKPHMVREQVLLGDWSEVQDIPVETLRKWTDDPDKLDGLILKGYEMKFGTTNENGEQYDKTAFDEFIQRYFVDGKLNMPVDINHNGWNDWRSYCGRVLYIEVNSVGFYFVVYVPKTYPEYDRLKWMLQEGLVQGFSKEGFVDWGDSEYKWKDDGSFDYELIHKIAVVSVSLVCTPANGLPFEQMKETRNALAFVNKLKEQDNAAGSTLAAMFNN